MVGQPTAIPVTTPDAEPTVANEGLLLVQTPPVVASVRVPVVPTHMLVGPAIGAGDAFTVTTWVEKQPVLRV